MSSTTSRALLALRVAAALGAMPLPAQPAPDSGAVSVAGAGAETWVLVSGTVGGIAGFRRLEARLLARGQRVVLVDPFRLSLDSADVSFAAMARRVDAVLAREGVTAARVVGHSHGGGVALRLAANAPPRVTDLWLLDVGGLESSRSPILGAALRLVPLVARIPGGRRLLRERFVHGLRENSARDAWLDSTTIHAYADPLFDHLDRAVALAIRYARAREPEPLAQVVARVRVPVTVVLGDAPHASGPAPGEVETLLPLGGRLRVAHLAGVGHFLPQEAPDELAALLLAPRVVSCARVAASSAARAATATHRRPAC